MTRSITLELPDTLIEHAQRKAERSGHPLEAVLTDWLEQAAGQDMKTLLEGVHHVYTPLDSDATAHDLQKILEDFQAGNLNADKVRS